MEMRAHSAYSESDYDIHFWRTKSGLEVDFILGNGDVALEVKGTDRVDNRDIKPILAFTREYSPRLSLMVCNERTKRIHGGITIIPWREFLQDLWGGRII
jgi:predicted AAA+ superfamily ATPase